jgi:hypothetical protein
MLRQPEIEQLRASRRQHDVARLEVSMNDAVATGGVERVSDFDRDAERLLELQPSALAAQSIGEGPAFEVLERSRRASRAGYTPPIPPDPSGATISP